MIESVDLHSTFQHRRDVQFSTRLDSRLLRHYVHDKDAAEFEMPPVPEIRLWRSSRAARLVLRSTCEEPGGNRITPAETL